MNQPKFLYQIPGLLKQAFLELRKNDPLRMAGATAFFTTFALPAILIIIIQLFGLFINPKVLSSELINRLTGLLGPESGNQLRVTLLNFRELAENWYITIAGFIFLTFVATTLFNVIKNAFDQIWSIKIKSHPGLLFTLKIRTKSFIAILLAGILFLAGLLTDGLEVFLGKNINVFPEDIKAILQGALTQIISAVIYTCWFIMLFRYLADGKPSWLGAIAGGIVTGVLFSAGKLLIKWALLHSNVGTIYGASGSIVLLLLFVFYSSFVLYYGASFIRVFAEATDQKIEPIRKAYVYEMEEQK